MAKDIDINVQDAIFKLRSEFSNLTNSQVSLAIARAINHTIAKGKTAASRDIRGVYKVKAKDINGKLVAVKANRSNLTATIRVSTRPMPIIGFGARQNKKGVSVSVMGKRETINSAFIRTMKSGHKGVFVRGRYQGNSLTYRTKRIKKKGPDTPIEEVMTASAFSMITHERVQKVVAAKIESSFSVRLLHELRRM